MSHYYGEIRAAFHGRAGDLRKLAPLVWQNEKLETLKTDLTVDPSVEDDAVLTLSAQLFNDPLTIELPCIDNLANRCPEIEIAVAACISDSITDTPALYSAFYPLGREVYEAEEEEEEEEPNCDPMDYVSYQPDQMEITLCLEGYHGDFYEDIDLCDEKIRPEDWDFWATDPDVLDFLESEDLEEAIAPLQAVMLKCTPQSGEVSRVLDYQPGGPLPAGVRMEEKEGRRFYLDGEGNDYFPLSEIPIEDFHFGKITIELFQDRLDYPDWLREWY